MGAVRRGGFGSAGALGGAGGSSPGGSPYTMTAGAGSFILTGDNMTPLVDYRIPADVGAFTLTGQDATLSSTAAGGTARQFASITQYLNTATTARSFASIDQYVVA
jgi:hypothetical protein